MKRRGTVLLCLVFSGLSALVYQIVWTRLLGFAFGTTTEAVSTVLAVFFGGLALGSYAAARLQPRVRRPLRVYALLELGVGAWALASLPLLQHMDLAFHAVGVPETQAGLAALRVLLAALILLPPTAAMGATLPMAVRGVVNDEEGVGRGSARLYAANTLGAVAGAYLCGFWWIPCLGLARSLFAAAATNLASAALAWAVGRRLPAAAPSPPPAAAAGRPRSDVFLACFGVSGFVAIGYEIVWSKVFGIVMEGTLYGFAAVLSAYLLGIALGSAAVARSVDRIRDLPRAFALVHMAIGAAVFLGAALIPYLPYAYGRLVGAFAGDAIHLLFLLVLPVVLVPTVLFGAAFPILIRLHAPAAASAGRSVGIASAVNTAGSIAASAIVGFWWIPGIGSDGSLYALLLLDLATALLLLVGFQQSRGPARWTSLAGSAAVVGTVALAFGGVHVEEAIAGRQVRADDLAGYLEGLESDARERAITIEGRSAVVSVHDTRGARQLSTNGLQEAGVRYGQPYSNREALLLGIWPYLWSARAERALVIGLGGGNTLAALLETRLRAVDVVELEKGVTRAVELLHEGRRNPLDDARVSLRIADGRNDLLLRNASGAPGYDLITSQPSHPWRVGAANLFTEEFFRTARAALREGGVFASWLNAFRIDPESLLAVVTSFERVFPGAVLIDVSSVGRQAFLLAGSTEPLVLDLDRARARLAEPRLAGYLAPYDVGDLEDILARVEGPAAVFAAIAPGASNTDDNAFVETRTPRAVSWQRLDFSEIESRLAPGAPLLPPMRGRLDAARVARALLVREADGPWPYRGALERLLVQFGSRLPATLARRLRAEADLRDPAREQAALAELAAVAREQPSRPEALRAIGMHLAERRSDWRGASAAFAAAYARSGEARDAYDAGRALHPADPDAALAWFERIPADQRDAYPRLAYYRARAAFAHGARGDALRSDYAALTSYLQTAEGRRYPGAHELAAQIAWALGDPIAARAHADADAHQRAARARPDLEKAEQAFEAGDLARAQGALASAARLVPADERVALLGAELALASGSSEDLEEALLRLRRWAGSVVEANVAENRFRMRHGMPLRPERAGGSPGS